MRAFAIECRTESWHQVYLPWFRAVAQPFSMCMNVGYGHKQRGHFGSVCILRLHRFNGVDRQSELLSTGSLLTGQLAGQTGSRSKLCSLTPGQQFKLFKLLILILILYRIHISIDSLH